MLARLVSTGFAAFVLAIPLLGVGCHPDAVEEIDFYYPVQVDQPLVIKVNSKAEMLLHGRWVPIYERPKYVEDYFQKVAERYRQAYELNNRPLMTRVRRGKTEYLIPAPVIIEVDTVNIRTGTVNHAMRRAREVGFFKEPELRAHDAPTSPGQ